MLLMCGVEGGDQKVAAANSAILFCMEKVIGFLREHWVLLPEYKKAKELSEHHRQDSWACQKCIHNSEEHGSWKITG